MIFNGLYFCLKIPRNSLIFNIKLFLNRLESPCFIQVFFVSLLYKEKEDMTNNKQIVWIDMDGVIVDFAGHVKDTLKRNPHLVNEYAGREDHIHGIFRNPKPIEGAIEAINKLAESGKYELYIATACPWGNPEGATDKRYWIEEHFGNLFHKKMAVTHLKNLLIGDYLIDDRLKNGAEDFKGKHLHFGTYDYPNWDSILKELL